MNCLIKAQQTLALGISGIIVSEVQPASTTANEILTRERELSSMSTVTLVVVLAIVTMTFGAMITVFLFRSQEPMLWGNLRVPPILYATTAILLASSGFLEAARHKLARRDQDRFFKLTAIATGLGVVFLIGQVIAWFQVLNSSVVLAKNAHSWFIFLFSGLHGLHILVGLGGLAYLLVRTHQPAGGPKYQMKTRVVANGVSIFWHYLDFLWLVLFTLLLTWHR